MNKLKCFNQITLKAYIAAQSILDHPITRISIMIGGVYLLIDSAAADITDAGDKEALTKLKDTILAPKWLKAGEIAAGAIGITMGILKSSAVPFLIGMSTGAVIHFFASNLNSGIGWIN